jgi:hypothetical protein
MADEDTTGAGDKGADGTEGQGSGGSGQEQGGGETLMTAGNKGGQETGAEGGKDGKPEGKDADKAADKDADPSAKVPDTPEGYDLKFSASTTVDKELLAGFQKTAHELGINAGQAQKLAALYEGHMAKAGERMQAEYTKFLLDARKGWEAEIEKSPTFEADRANIQTALRRFGDQELYDLLDQTNLGSHPKMWAFMAAVGKALVEPGFRGGSGNSGGEKSAAEILYPNMAR